MKVVAGLGNPGPEYSATRHNIGFMVAELFAARNGIALKKKGHQALYGVGRCNGHDLLVLLPQTYMNRSGASVGSVVKAQKLKEENLIVLHDEIDLPFGTLRIKAGEGMAVITVCAIFVPCSVTATLFACESALGDLLPEEMWLVMFCASFPQKKKNNWMICCC